MRKIITVFITCLLLAFFPCVALGVSVTPYSSIDDSSSYANLLTDLYVNQADYSPKKDFVIIRVGQYDYTLYYSEDFESTTQYISVSAYQGRQNISFGSVSSLNISNPSDYNIVGSISGTSCSKLANDFKFQYIIIAVAILVSVLLLLRLIKRVRPSGSSSKGFTVR